MVDIMARPFDEQYPISLADVDTELGLDKNEMMTVTPTPRANPDRAQYKPTDFHQLSTLRCLSPHTPYYIRRRYLLSSAAFVLLEILVISTILFGTFRPPCSEIRSNCPRGMWCPYGSSSPYSNQCMSCAKSTTTLETFNATLYCNPSYCSSNDCSKDILQK